MAYIAASWRLGWWEFGTKIFVVQEVCTYVCVVYTTGCNYASDAVSEFRCMKQ